MKQTIKKIVPFAFAIAALFAISCSETSDDADTTLTPSSVEYTATFTLTLSDAFLDSSIGTLSVECTDQNGDSETTSITSSPFSISITDLEEGDSFSFDVDFELASGYTQPAESQNFSYGYSIGVVDSDGGSVSYSSSSQSLTITPENVEAYVEGFTKSYSKTI